MTISIVLAACILGACEILKGAVRACVECYKERKGRVLLKMRSRTYTWETLTCRECGGRVHDDGVWLFCKKCGERW